MNCLSRSPIENLICSLKNPKKLQLFKKKSKSSERSEEIPSEDFSGVIEELPSPEEINSINPEINPKKEQNSIDKKSLEKTKNGNCTTTKLTENFLNENWFNELKENNFEKDEYTFSYEKFFKEARNVEEFNFFNFILMLQKITYKKIDPRIPKKEDIRQITLVLDLDETLVHCSTEYIENYDTTISIFFGGAQHKIYVKKRPYFEEFLKFASNYFEVIIFTASQKIYADTLLNALDPENQFFVHRIFRDSCIQIEGNYLKDLRVTGRDLSSVVLVDNSPHVFGFHPENGIPILSYFNDDNDTELIKLVSFLKNLINVDDVRPIIRQKFQFDTLLNQHKNKINLPVLDESLVGSDDHECCSFYWNNVQ